MMSVLLAYELIQIMHNFIMIRLTTDAPAGWLTSIVLQIPFSPSTLAVTFAELQIETLKL